MNQIYLSGDVGGVVVALALKWWSLFIIVSVECFSTVSLFLDRNHNKNTVLTGSCSLCVLRVVVKCQLSTPALIETCLIITK